MIVVGFDGSRHSKHALGWASAEARLRDTGLRVLHAWKIPQILPLVTADRPRSGGVPPLAELRQTAQQRLQRQVADLLPNEDADRVRCEAVHGHAPKLLLAASADAELLVVGSRGLGTAAGLLLGSVSLACVHEAGCPVVIVRGSAVPGEGTHPGSY